MHVIFKAKAMTSEAEVRQLRKNRKRSLQKSFTQIKTKNHEESVKLKRCFVRLEAIDLDNGSAMEVVGIKPKKRRRAISPIYTGMLCLWLQKQIE